MDSAQGLFDSLKAIFEKSKEEVVRGARVSRVRLDVYQLRREREHALRRLGEEAYELIQQGQIPGLMTDAYAAVVGADERIAACEAELATLADAQVVAAPVDAVRTPDPKPATSAPAEPAVAAASPVPPPGSPEPAGPPPRRSRSAGEAANRSRTRGDAPPRGRRGRT
ncbi:hypothetical protein L6R50_27520 [Myxococcota bacterium]|nr:hypothetical protein [Myxococcota bacterium]